MQATNTFGSLAQLCKPQNGILTVKSCCHKGKADKAAVPIAKT
jgi:hypothetical protein